MAETTPTKTSVAATFQHCSLESLSKEIDPELVTVGVVQIQLRICDFCVV